jgi:hypothetical protein
MQTKGEERKISLKFLEKIKRFRKKLRKKTHTHTHTSKHLIKKEKDANNQRRGVA